MKRSGLNFRLSMGSKRKQIKLWRLLSNMIWECVISTLIMLSCYDFHHISWLCFATNSFKAANNPQIQTSDNFIIKL